jgi:hypothetical protein
MSHSLRHYPTQDLPTTALELLARQPFASRPAHLPQPSFVTQKNKKEITATKPRQDRRFTQWTTKSIKMP